MKLLDEFKYNPRVYVVSTTDKMSAQRALTLEKLMMTTARGTSKGKDKGGQGGKSTAKEQERSLRDPKVVRIPRSREVGQSYLTSIFTTLYSLLASMHCVVLERPDLLLCNGPGTCLPVCVSARLFKPFSKIKYTYTF